MAGVARILDETEVAALGQPVTTADPHSPDPRLAAESGDRFTDGQPLDAALAAN